jgi:hypothetical protein
MKMKMATKSKKKIPPKKAKIEDVDVTAGAAKPEPVRRSATTGLLDQIIDVPFEVLGAERRRWLLSAAEKKYLHESVNDILGEYGADVLEKNVWFKFAVVLGAIIIPRAIMEAVDYAKTKRKINPKTDGIRPAKQDTVAVGQKGPGQDKPDYEYVSPTAGQVGPPGGA